MPEREIQLELPFDAIRIRTPAQLSQITASWQIMRLHIADLLALAERSYIRDANQMVTGISDVESLARISRFLVGRVTEMQNQQKKAYQLLVARLAQFLPAAQPKKA